MTLRAILLVALAGLAGAGAARADEVEAAKARFRRGVELYRAKRFADAAEEFEAAYRLKPHGAIHFNVAQCRERLEQWPAAYRAYSDYLREVPDAKDRAAVRASMRGIEGQLAKSGAQLLLVYTEPPGARVTVDGRDRGTSPVHLVLPPGAYPLGLALEGHDPVSERVELPSAASVVIDRVLSRAAPLAAAPATPAALANAEATASPTAAAGHDLAARPPAGDAGSLPLAPPPAAAKRMWPVWVAAGTAVAAATAGLLFGASARSDARALDAMATPDGARANQLASSAQTKARTANVLLGVSGGAAVAAGALYLIEARF